MPLDVPNEPEAFADIPLKGYGLGLRPVHFPEILADGPESSKDWPIDWFEIISENYMNVGGLARRNLARVRETYPIVMHGVSLSIGGSDPIDEDYLKSLKDLMTWIQPSLVSDHLCWTGGDGINMHDLLPLPFTREAVRHVAERIGRVQEYLGRRIMMENVSSYVTYLDSEMTEWEFLGEVVTEADCDILLDVNNIYVSSFNHGFDPVEYLDAVPGERVRQFHLAGHENTGDFIIDTHDHPIIDNVWDLYAEAAKRFPSTPAMIERDDHIPPLAELVAELNHAREIGEAARQEPGA